MAENTKVVLEALPHGEPTHLTPGEVEKTAAMMLSDLQMERA